MSFLENFQQLRNKRNKSTSTLLFIRLDATITDSFVLHLQKLITKSRSYKQSKCKIGFLKKLEIPENKVCVKENVSSRGLTIIFEFAE